MARRGYTIKPCHGCGSTQEHPSNEVCIDCKTKFEQTKEYKKIIIEMQNDKQIAVKIPDQWCHPLFFPKRMGELECDYETIGNILRDIAKKVSMDTPKNYYSFTFDKKYSVPSESSNIIKAECELFSEEGSTYEFTTVVIMNKGTYKLLEKLYREIKKELLSRENQAFDYGKNLLMMLKNGKITEKDFETMG